MIDAININEEDTVLARRKLGRTGHENSVVALGTAAFWDVSQETADRAIQQALDAGVNHFDVAPAYGQAEQRIAPWMPKIRDRIFLGCKTTMRTRDEAKAELHRSLERLGVERLDLYQLHGVNNLEVLDQCTRPGGALEAFVEARNEGLIRFIGITGHTHRAPAAHLEGLHRFDFDTVMFPLNFVLHSIPEYRRDAEVLLDACAERDIASTSSSPSPRTRGRTRTTPTPPGISPSTPPRRSNGRCLSYCRSESPPSAARVT